ncbi:carbamoyl-phosphate synthase pyrimidine-specific large chain [Gracilaria domingensis]|nr:carbamoyl-phosphate synthase pyrimidine-specific large chain [Gracilaria domingensis]
MGTKFADLGPEREIIPKYTCVKETVLPFKKLPGADILLSQEMRSTGELMGIDDSFAVAYAKAKLASGLVVPTSGPVFISLGDQDEDSAIPIASDLVAMRFKIFATRKAYVALMGGGLNPADVEMVLKVDEGRTRVLDKI